MELVKIGLVIFSGIGLSACVGGGGGGGGGGGVSSTLAPFARPMSGGDFQPISGSGTRSVIQNIYTRDLNQDQVDEVVMGGRLSQPVAEADWRSYNLQVYGWNTGSFQLETSSWFSGNENQILGTEPSIRFGDFNGDGHVDMYVAPSTDMPLYSNGKVFFNSGSSSFLRAEISMTDVWAHDSTVGDFNNDGFDDILTLDYNGRPVISFGSNTGSFTSYRGIIGSTGGSGVSVADYLGNGTQTFVVTDAISTGNQDIKLYSWAVNTGELVLTEVAALPPSRFYLSKWDDVRIAAGRAPHEVRTITMDFDRDGNPDVLVLSTLPDPANGNIHHGFSEVQFLRNNGSGVFVDVTDTVLVGYDTSTKVSYSPVLIDVNQDGLLDILLSAGGEISDYASTRVLLATSDGFYKQSYVSVFQDFYSQTRSMTDKAFEEIQPLNIAQGPNNNLYLISAVNFDDRGNLKTRVYAAKIESNGTVSVQSTLDSISTTWPYLSGTEANNVLEQSSSLSLNGIPVIDWASAMSPIGGLGISLDGRLGTRQPIIGGISAPGLEQKHLQNIAAVDALGRHFQINMGTMSTTMQHMPVRHGMIGQDVTQNWSSRFIDTKTFTDANISVGGDAANFSFSVSDRSWTRSKEWVNRIGMTRMVGSPWLGFTGIFGKIHNSTSLDFSSTRFFDNKNFIQAGIIQTSTNFSAGLVTGIDPIWSGYIVSGHNNESWSIYGGLQPTIFSGNITLKLPVSVDTHGTMHYSTKRISIRNQPIGFVGSEYRFKLQNHAMKFSSVINETGNYQLQATYSYGF